MYLKIVFINLLLTLNIFASGNSLNLRNNIEDDHPIQISPNGWNYKPTVSPNHRYISFLHGNPMSDEEYYSGRIWLYKIGEKRMQKLSNLELIDLIDDIPVWSKDSQTLYFSSGGVIYNVNMKDLKVDSLFWTENKHVSFFAPGLSNDGKKLAFWSFSRFDKVSYHSIWVLDLNNGDVKKFPEVEYGPGTEVMWTRPQWNNDDSKIIAAFFPPGEYSDQTDLYLLNMSNYSQSKMPIYNTSSYFKFVGDSLYYTSNNDPKLWLCSYNTQTLVSSKIFTINKDQFDIINNKDSVKIIFDKNGKLVIYNNNSIKELNIKGENPQYYNPYLIYEKHEKIGKNDESKLYLINNYDPK